MKNFKKLFAIVSSVMMLASIAPTATLGATYSDELQGAYDYAYGIGITTQSSIDTANMYGTLLRAHMAKMMVNYAKEVLGKTADTSLECEFTDVANQTEELQGYIKEACQLGLMGVGVTAFNPNGVVTRAQFGTVLSRALYGDTYNGGDPYYADHLAALQDAGIMTNISNPNAPEIRGYVMLMMQRAAGDTTPEVCTTPENTLSCSLGLDTCPAQCQTNNEVKEGTLSLSSVGVDYTSIPKDGLVKFGSIKLTAGSSDISVTNIKIKKLGLSDIPTTTKVFFEKDGTRVSSKVSFDSTTKVATVIFTTPLVVKSSETIDVIMSLSGVSANEDIQLASTDVNSSAADVNGSFTSAVLRTSSYGVLSVKSTQGGSDISNAKVDETKLIELGQLQIQKDGTGNSTRAVIVKALTLNTSGINTADLSYLKDVAIYRDDVKVSTKTTIGTKTISFVLDDEIKTTTTSNVTYVIKGKIAWADKAGEKYSFYMKNVEDLTVLEKDTSFRCTNVPQAGTMPTITVTSADVRLNEYTISPLTVVPGTKSVIFYSGSIQSTKTITLDTLQNMAASVNNWSGLDKVLDNLYVKIGNYVIAVDSIPSASSTTSLKFEGQATVNGTLPLMVYGDIKTDAPATFIQFTSDISNSSFLTKEDANGDSVSILGTVGGRKVTITAASMTLSNSSASTKNVQRWDSNVELAKLEFATTSDVTSRLYSFKADIGGTGRNLYDGAQVSVYDNAWTLLVSDTVTSGTTKLNFVLPNYVSISKNNPANFTLKLSKVPNTVSTADKYFYLTFAKTDVVAKEIINRNTVQPAANATSTLLKSVLGGSAEVVNQSYTNSLVKYGTLAIVGNIKIKAVNADVLFKDAYFTLSGLNTANMSKVSSAKLYEDGTEIATLIKDGTLLYVTDLNKTITVGSTKTYEIKANISAVNTNADVLPTFVTKLTTGTFESTYGNALTPLTDKDISNTVKVVNEIPTIVAVDGYTKGNDVVYKLTLTGSKEVDLSGLTLSVNGTNLTGGLSGTNAYLAPADINYTTTNYTTANVAWTTLTFAGLAQGDLAIQGTKVVYVILKNAALLANTNGNTATVRVAATDMDYMDIFADDNSAYLNAGMLYNYSNAIAGTLDLLKVVTIQ